MPLGVIFGLCSLFLMTAAVLQMRLAALARGQRGGQAHAGGGGDDDAAAAGQLPLVRAKRSTTDDGGQLGLAISDAGDGFEAPFTNAVAVQLTQRAVGGGGAGLPLAVPWPPGRQKQ